MFIGQEGDSVLVSFLLLDEQVSIGHSETDANLLSDFNKDWSLNGGNASCRRGNVDVVTQFDEPIASGSKIVHGELDAGVQLGTQGDFGIVIGSSPLPLLLSVRLFADISTPFPVSVGKREFGLHGWKRVRESVIGIQVLINSDSESSHIVLDCKSNGGNEVEPSEVRSITVKRRVGSFVEGSDCDFDRGGTIVIDVVRSSSSGEDASVQVGLGGSDVGSDVDVQKEVQVDRKFTDGKGCDRQKVGRKDSLLDFSRPFEVAVEFPVDGRSKIDGGAEGEVGHV